jgi:imidazolonepropionase-like amidohydrolase
MKRGITGLRSVGEAHFLDVALRKAFQTGRILGPNMLVCGHVLVPLGGHIGGPFAELFAVEASGPAGFLEAARAQVKGGADYLKFIPTSGSGDAPRGMISALLMDPEEMDAVVRVAHQRGMLVSAHGGDLEGIKAAVRAGVDVIEHGYQLDKEALQMMVDRNVALCPTLVVRYLAAGNCASDYEEVYLDKFYRSVHRLPKSYFDNMGALWHAHLESFRLALEYDVKILAGAGLNPIPITTFLEIELMGRCGMSNSAVLASLTRSPAEIYGYLGELGTVSVGRKADLTVCRGNPLDNLCHLRDPVMVLKDGNIVQNRLEGISGDRMLARQRDRVMRLYREE